MVTKWKCIHIYTTMVNKSENTTDSWFIKLKQLFGCTLLQKQSADSKDILDNTVSHIFINDLAFTHTT